MRKGILLILMMAMFSISMANGNIELARKEFKNAVYNDKLTNQLCEVLISSKQQDALTQAYIAYFTALKAKHVSNPYAKIEYVRNFDRTIKKAIELAPDNLEIRFLRFSVQDNIPLYLGFSKELDIDKKIIVQQLQKNITGVSGSFKQDMKTVLLNSK
ncbi:MAG: hypothetical protein RI952_600, partial [Bacteroidota bacterium]